MTGIEIAAWLIVHAGNRPVTMLLPEFAKHIPVEVHRIIIRSYGAYMPDDALVGKAEVAVLLAE